MCGLLNGHKFRSHHYFIDMTVWRCTGQDTGHDLNVQYSLKHAGVLLLSDGAEKSMQSSLCQCELKASQVVETGVTVDCNFSQMEKWIYDNFIWRTDQIWAFIYSKIKLEPLRFAVTCLCMYALDNVLFYLNVCCFRKHQKRTVVQILN